jgi:hypothetical protein
MEIEEVILKRSVLEEKIIELIEEFNLEIGKGFGYYTTIRVEDVNIEYINPSTSNDSTEPRCCINIRTSI